MRAHCSLDHGAAIPVTPSSMAIDRTALARELVDTASTPSPVAQLVSRSACRARLPRLGDHAVEIDTHIGRQIGLVMISSPQQHAPPTLAGNVRAAGTSMTNSQ